MVPNNDPLAEELPVEEPMMEEPVLDEEMPMSEDMGMEEPVEEIIDEGIDEETEEASAAMNEEEIAVCMRQLLLDARNEDRFVRDNNLILWRRLDYYWNNILDIFQDPITHDYRQPNWEELGDEVPPRLINIYRPHGEAIVAALSVTVPAVFFHPDDADNPDDTEAAKNYRNIVELLQLHNDAPMSFIRVIVGMLNQGTVFGYNYYHADPSFGTIKKPRVEYKDISLFEVHCPQCGNPLDGGIGTPQGEIYSCDICGYEGPAEPVMSLEKIPQIVGFDNSPKGLINQEIFTGLNVKVPAYTRKQSECGYLLLEFLQATPMLRSIIPEKADKINGKKNTDWENFSKIPLQYLGEMPDNASNVSCLWLRPWQFWQIEDKSKVELLTQQFPDGCYALFIDDEYMYAYPENMDHHWTISDNPMGNSIYARPMGENLATVQDIRAQLVEIEIQTAEFGIPETFADPRVLDFKKYGKGRSQPGMVTQAKAQAGKSIADGFHTSKPAILSQEIDPLRQHIDQDAQFVLGSFPSVYGGPSVGGSKTAKEYEQSKSMALQRLGTTWKIATNFWAKFQSRSAVEYAQVVKELGQDEKFTKREGPDNYVNVWIKHAALTGKVGRCEPESSEQLPVSWAQKKDAIQGLLSLGNEEILAILGHPRNMGLMKEAIGLTDLYIPGDEDRLRQQKEFQMLSQGIPIPINAMIDDSAIHAEVLKSILEGPVYDEMSEEGKMACFQHLMEHEQVNAEQMAAQQEQEQQEQNPANSEKKGKNNAE